MGSFVMWMFVFPSRPYDRDTLVQYTRLIVLLGIIRGVWLSRTSGNSTTAVAVGALYLGFVLDLLVNIGFLTVARGRTDHDAVSIRLQSEAQASIVLLVTLGAIYVHYIIQSAQSLLEATAP